MPAMTDPSDTDDGWADLPRELGLEGGAAPKPAPAPSRSAPPPEEEPDEEPAAFGPALYDEGEPAAEYADAEEGGEDETGEEGEDAEPAGEPGAAGEGETDPNKKR